MSDKRVIHKTRGPIVLLLAGLVLAFALGINVSVSQAVATAPTLGTADSFAVLGGSTVTNSGPTIVTGDLGVSPGSAIVGFDIPGGPGTVVGVQHAADAVALQAQSDAGIAYDFLKAQGVPVTACDFTGQRPHQSGLSQLGHLLVRRGFDTGGQHHRPLVPVGIGHQGPHPAGLPALPDLSHD